MYFRLEKGEVQRALNSYNIEGGLHIMGISAMSYPGSNCYDPMTPLDTTGLNCYLINATPDVIAGSSKLYLLPNPTQGDLTFYFESEERGLMIVKVYDLYGKIWLEKRFEKSGKDIKSDIETSSLSKGMYIFNISDKRGGNITTTFIKL